MSVDVVVPSLQKLAEQTFQCDLSAHAPDVVRERVEQWDSLGHLMLIMAVEERFGISFSADDVQDVTSLRTLAQMVERKKTAS